MPQADVVLRRLIAALEASLTETVLESPTVFEAIEEFCEEKDASGAADRTVQTYRHRLATFSEVYGYTPVADVLPKDITRYVSAMRAQSTIYEDHPYRETEDRRLSPSTISGRIQSVKTFFRWCDQHGYCDKNPAKHITRREPEPSVESRAMEPETLRRMIAVASYDATVKGRPRNLALILFLADTGCRVGEVVTMLVDHLEIVHGVARVAGKSGPRDVFFTNRTARALDYWLADRPDCDHDYVFCSVGDMNRGAPMTTGSVYQAFRDIANRGGVADKRFNPHAIRHLVGQTFTDNSNLELARKKLGHSSITVTAQYYANQDRARLKKATEDWSLVKYSPPKKRND